jgi:hypothetical protein
MACARQWIPTLAFSGIQIAHPRASFRGLISRPITRAIGEGVSEIQIDVGPGYGLYFVRRAETEYLLLAGGDKSTQVRDIRRAKTMMRELKESGAR